MINRKLRFFNLFNLAALLVLWPIQNFAPERFWPVMFLVIAPPIIFLISVLLLFAISWKRRFRSVIITQIAAGIFWFAAFSGFCFPLHLKTQPEYSAPQKIKAMTYNIRSGSLGINEVVATIAAQNPDILILQEAWAHDARRDPVPIIQARLKNYQQARHQQLVIFSKFPIEEKHYHALPDHQVGILEAELNVNGAPLTVFCAHFAIPLNGAPLDWPREIPKMARIRQAQWELLNRVANQSGASVIIAGDFNTPPRGVLYRGLASQFSDAFKNSGRGFGQTFPAGFPLQRIDYLWTSRDVKATRVEVLPSRASDHRALVGEFSIAQNSPAKPREN